MKTVLIVVEAKGFAKAVRNFLCYLGFSVQVVNAPEQWKYRIEKAPDVIVLKPPGRGKAIASVVGEIRRQIPKTVVIYLTARENSRLQKEARKRAVVILLRGRNSLLRLSHAVRRLRRG